MLQLDRATVQDQTRPSQTDPDAVEPVRVSRTQATVGTPPNLASLDDFPGTLAQKTYGSLKKAILSLQLKPGEVLRKPEICQQLGVSRSPVAEALARLAVEGLVDVVPQAGTFVARFSIDEIREGAFLREALELATVELLATTITDDQLVQLRRNLRIQAALVGDGDFPGFYQMDGQMHELMMSFTGFKRLPQIAETSWVHVDRARQLILPQPGRVQATLKEHEAILDALEKRDPDAARIATRHHLRQLVALLEPMMRYKPELFVSL
ncbi:MAG: GntR family transcriptional regulator [Rhizobiales bacterium]|nr:GntR family transcriptional regulator [Hyphomicrobiales bacterium]MBO6698135.1 GntR family transcriptional regulator [Hyphomicrobiales bacterium]MBO6735611.1 GntR family transcriptional regulator [Hyphomicrobiales bacterium]MBO6910581.1 GntR family transcriptional regulator [Hyphomicrobiales bacterium]MBO6957299.1 GntR family transcriptional regulator [Hyphomicrobiales bacterium]